MKTNEHHRSTRQTATLLVVDAEVVSRAIEARTHRGYNVLKASRRAQALTQRIPKQSKSNGRTRNSLRFGDLIAAVYKRCGKARANGLLRLAVNANLVVFPGNRRFMIVEQ